MLAHIGGDDGLPLRLLIDRLNDCRAGQCLMVVFQRILCFQLLDLCKPFCVILGRDPLCQLLQAGFQISGHGGGHMNVLVHLCRVDIQLDDLRLAGKFCRIADDTVAEPGTEHHQQVTLGHTKIGRLRTVHAQHTGVQIVRARERALAHQRICHRGLQLLHKCPHFLRRIGKDGAAAHQDIWLLRRIDECNCPGKLCLRNICFLLNRCRYRRLIFGHGRRHIFGHIHQHRAGPAGSGDLEGPADRIRQVIDIFHNKVVLCHRHGDARDIHLLEAVLAKEGHTHVGRDGHNRNRIHIGGGNTGHQVGGTGAGGSHAYAHLAGSPGIAVCRMGSPLLMGGQHMPELISVFINCIIYIQDRAAGISENRINSLLFQAL